MDDNIDPVEAERRDHEAVANLIESTRDEIASYVIARGVILDPPDDASQSDLIVITRNNVNLISLTTDIAMYRSTHSKIDDPDVRQQLLDMIGLSLRTGFVLEGEVTGPWVDYVEDTIPGAWPTDLQIQTARAQLEIDLRRRREGLDREDFALYLDDRAQSLLDVLNFNGYPSDGGDVLLLLNILMSGILFDDPLQRRASALDSIKAHAAFPNHPAWVEVINLAYPI